MGSCLAKSKSVTQTTSNQVRMASKNKQLINKCKRHTVTNDELWVLRELFLDLAKRTEGADCIDKSIFLLFFPLPVIYI